MLSNAYFLAKFRFDTAENEPTKNLQKLQILQILPIFSWILLIQPDAAFGAAAFGAAGFGAAAFDAAYAASVCSGPVVANFWANFRQNVDRFRLYRRQSLQENTRFAAFFKIYQII